MNFFLNHRNYRQMYMNFIDSIDCLVIKQISYVYQELNVLISKLLA